MSAATFTMLAGLLAATALGGCRGVPKPGAGYALLTPQQLRDSLAAHRPLVIVDVREPWEFAGGHIPGARLMPYGDAKRRALQELKKDDAIVFVCHTGPMGDELAQLLVTNGYPHVANLVGGMGAWTGPTVSGG